MQYRVFHGVEYNFYIFRVHRGGEVMEKRLSRVPFHRYKHIQYKVLHILHGMRISCELRKIPTNVRVGRPYFFIQQIGFIQEQYNRHSAEYHVIDYRVEYIPRFLQSVGSPATFGREFFYLTTLPPAVQNY